MSPREQLRISVDTFVQLATSFEMPLAFIDCLLRHQEQIMHFGSRFILSPANSYVYGMSARIYHSGNTNRVRLLVHSPRADHNEVYRPRDAAQRFTPITTSISATSTDKRPTSAASR